MLMLVPHGWTAPSPAAPPALQDSHTAEQARQTAVQHRQTALQDRQTTLQDRRTALEARRAALQQEKKEKGQERQAWVQERTEQRGKAEDALREQRATEEQLRMATDAETRDSLRRMSDSIQAHATAINADIAAMNEGIAAINAGIATIDTRVDEIDAKLDSVQGVCQRFTADCAWRSACFPSLIPPLPAGRACCCTLACTTLLISRCHVLGYCTGVSHSCRVPCAVPRAVV